jgi:predicted PurR-regulated permease PerM
MTLQRRAGETEGDPDRLLRRASEIATIVIAAIATIVALRAGQVVVAPVALAIFVGLMLTPVAIRLENLGLRQGMSAILLVMLFVAGWAVAMALLAGPLGLWIERLPLIWRRLQMHMSDWRDVIASFSDFREQLGEITSSGGEVSVVVTEDGPAIPDVAWMAPSILSQTIVFLAALFFFLMTRISIREGILRTCLTFKTRVRAARVLRDIQTEISRYLLTITLINAALGIAVATAFQLLGVPSPMLWGALAFVMNFMIFLGPIFMVVILLGVGLATSLTTGGILLPALVYLGLNTVESQFVTPQAVGRTLTLNPLAVFVTIVFWLWLWGPVGGLIAVPSLMVVRVIWIRALAPGFAARARSRSVWNRARHSAFPDENAAAGVAPEIEGGPNELGPDRRKVEGDERQGPAEVGRADR